jgi:DNA-3-methyladenine glycosylase II
MGLQALTDPVLFIHDKSRSLTPTTLQDDHSAVLPIIRVLFHEPFNVYISFIRNYRSFTDEYSIFVTPGPTQLFPNDQVLTMDRHSFLSMKSSLYPLSPHDFPLSASIFSDGDPAIRIYADGIFSQALHIRGRPVLIEVSSSGTTDKPELQFSVRAEGEEDLSGSDQKAAEQIVTSIFNINDDLIPFYRYVRADPVMSALITALRGLKSPTTPTIFEALVDSIVEQQISLSVAHVMQRRLIMRFGDSLAIQGSRYYCYPGPDVLSDVTDEQFRECGLSFRKGEYIRDISRSLVIGELDLDSFGRYPDTDEIVTELSRIRGIGRWTAELTLLRGMHRLDAFPADDLGVRRLISSYYRGGNPITAMEARNIAAGWGEWKGLAAFYLVMAELHGVLV